MVTQVAKSRFGPLLGAGLALAAGLVLMPHGAGAQTANSAAKPANAPKAKVTRFGNWSVVCPPDKGSKVPCFSRMTVRDKKRKVTLIAWTIGFNKAGKPLMEVLSPVDVVIAPGIQIALEPGKTMKLPYLTCGIRGCTSRIPMDKGLLAQLKAANSAKLSISATNGKRINFDMKMTGSAKAIQALGL